MDNHSFKLETDLNTLRSLVAVVEEEGFSAAAKRVHKTQSAISVQIAKLEEQLNTKLLERTSRSVMVTSAGEKFLSYARRILELADESVFTITEPENQSLLRVGFAEYLAPKHLDMLLGRFREIHPNCDMNLVFGLGSPLLESMGKDELDLVIAGPEADGGEILWEEPLAWTGICTALDDKSEPFKLILMPPPCTYRKIVFDSLTKIAKPWKLSIEANSVQAVQAAVAAGLGVTILPTSAIRDDMPIIGDTLPELPNTFVKSYLNQNAVHPYAQRFVEFLKECIEETQGTD